MILDLDANATYAPSERLQGVITSACSRLGNPSSLHRGGQRAKAAIEGAREVIRALVGAGSNDTVVFTSGATECNNLILHQVSTAQSPARVVSSTIEHPCVLEPLKALQRIGCTVTLVNPTQEGEVLAGTVAPAVTTEDQLVSVMWANNETGVLNDIPHIAAAVRSQAPRTLIHSDSAQLIGKLPVDFKRSALDAMTISGHKFGALPGVGALIVREGVSLAPQLLGGPQEQKLRGGTENLLGIVSLAAAANEVLETLSERTIAMAAVRDRFEVELRRALPDITIHGERAARLPNTSSITIPNIRGDDLVVALDLHGVQISSGAACSSGKPEPSHVLLALGQSEERARSTIRVSFRADQGAEVASRAVEVLVAAVSRMHSTVRSV